MLAKVSDFGMCLENTNYYVVNESAFPVRWTALEAIHEHRYSSKSDVWSFGIVLFEIYTNGVCHTVITL